MYKYFCFLVLFGIGLSCSSKVTPSRGSSSSISDYNEDLNHLLPVYDKVEITTPKEEIKEPEKIETIIANDNEKVDAALNKIIESNKSFNNGRGYRIQVFSGNSRSDFENAKNFLLRSFPQLEVYESYSQPTYRIKVGDFIHYQDADKYISTLKQRFGTTRIVNDKINIKKALNIK
jgi:hypothetical protein